MGVVAANHSGATISQVAVQWLLHRPCVDSVVIGPRTVKQFEDLALATTWKLDPSECVALTEASHEEAPYPWEMVWRCSSRGGERLDGNGWPLPSCKL